MSKPEFGPVSNKLEAQAKKQTDRGPVTGQMTGRSASTLGTDGMGIARSTTTLPIDGMGILRDGQRPQRR